MRHPKLRKGWGFVVQPLGVRGPPVRNYLWVTVGNFEANIVTRVRNKGQKTRYQVIVVGGFETDFASNPVRRLWGIFPPATGKHLRAALVHDWLYVKRRCLKNGEYVEITRLEADWIFRHIMLEDDVNPWLAKAAYSAVRAFARGEWEN